ncbi:MAG: nucleotidyl transferase AbiEii/AbiGii toxin family protein [Proteobacteria bacterium]|jgi:hypothetical protein|nr:nucleotidyl transferase AbiEii/AbiGii toxin family protein [Pseudomonadota bacterium]
MAESRLSGLQTRILVLLARLSPPWTLVGGAALAGFHFGHRTTRDLDLFFRRSDGLGDLGSQVTALIEAEGLKATSIRSTRDFVRLSVSSAEETVIVDLVSELAEPPCPPIEVLLGDATVQIASRGELLAAKLCTLMSRAEIRDLIDVRALLESGEDLARGMETAPLVDSGFSSMTLAWVLRDLDVAKLAMASGIDGGEAQKLAGFKELFVARLVEAARPQ